jgi:hypothetical protein
MSIKKVFSLCFLSNVDSTISKLKLNNGFKIEEMSYTEGIDLLCQFENMTEMQAYSNLVSFYRLIQSDEPQCTPREKQFYVIVNSYNCEINMDNEGRITEWDFDEDAKHDMIIHQYLNPTIKLMRLFKDGNIGIPLRYEYIYEGNKPKSFCRVSLKKPVSYGIFTIEDSKVKQLQEFINNTKIPFSDNIQLAFDNFNQSYDIDNENLSFLSLMICMEIFFNPVDQRELKNRISKGAAILIGKDRDDSINIYKDIKKLYDKRSSLVHSGKSITRVDLQKLRQYVRKSIKKILEIDEVKLGKNLEEFKKTLNLCGMGEKPWNIE